MRRVQTLADWLLLVGALALFASLFLTWSHQPLPSVPSGLDGSAAVAGLPRNPTAWEVYSVADVLLALLAGGLAALALRGRSRGARITGLVAIGVALAFVVHAASRAPSNGLYLPSLGSVGTAASPGVGEVVAIVALALAAAGLVISLGFDLSSNRVRRRHR